MKAWLQRGELWMMRGARGVVVVRPGCWPARQTQADSREKRGLARLRALRGSEVLTQGAGASATEKEPRPSPLAELASVSICHYSARPSTGLRAQRNFVHSHSLVIALRRRPTLLPTPHRSPCGHTRVSRPRAPTIPAPSSSRSSPVTCPNSPWYV